jgi:uncharacterized membrane protein YuzA (DUF378 family)
MDPGNLRPEAELAYGSGIGFASMFLHNVDVVGEVTRYATMLGAIFGAVVGAHAVYRLIYPKKRRNRRAEDRDEE